MATKTPSKAPATATLTPLPQVDDIPMRGEGYDPDRIREAFDAFRRHTAQLQAQLRVLQAAGQSAGVEPTGHAVRMDALHLIRAAAEFADTIERDAQTASASQLAKTEEEVRRRQRELQDREAEIERYRQESERQRAELMNNARNEARELAANANRDATQELREAEARAARLVEQARHQATELTNAARAEVEQMLEWSRAQASTIMARAQQGAEQLLASAGLGEDQVSEVGQAIVRAAESATEAARGPSTGRRPEPAPAATVASGQAGDDSESKAKAGGQQGAGRPKRDRPQGAKS
jgi:F0F1-type ATP synthase membrane subunit b/b'